MNELSALHPKRLKWRVEWMFHLVGEWLISRLPGRVVFRLGECVGGLLWHVMGRRRRVVLKNLRIAFYGEKGMDDLREMARATFRRSFANLFSAVRMAHVGLDELEASVELENPELAEEAVAKGRGILFLPPHMGNWEVLARMNRLYPAGHQAGAMYRPLNNPYLDERVARKRMSEGTRMFSKRDSLHQVGGFLKGGGLIGILADQRVGKQGVVVSFFGRLTRSSPLPGLLIRRCKSPALAISLKTIEPGRWSIRYHKVEEPGDTAACMDAIERAMRESPVDVFWLQDRWKVFIMRKKKKGIRTWLGENGLRSEKGWHRALVWLSGSPADWRIDEDWQHGDVVFEYVLKEGEGLPEWVGEGVVVHWVYDVDSVEGLMKEIEKIDMSHALPLDFILTGNSDRYLKRASEKEAIELFCV